MSKLAGCTIPPPSVRRGIPACGQTLRSIPAWTLAARTPLIRPPRPVDRDERRRHAGRTVRKPRAPRGSGSTRRLDGSHARTAGATELRPAAPGGTTADATPHGWGRRRDHDRARSRDPGAADAEPREASTTSTRRVEAGTTGTGPVDACPVHVGTTRVGTTCADAIGARAADPAAVGDTGRTTPGRGADGVTSTGVRSRASPSPPEGRCDRRGRRRPAARRGRRLRGLHVPRPLERDPPLEPQRSREQRPPAHR